MEEEHHPVVGRDESWWYGPKVLSKTEKHHPIHTGGLLTADKGLNNSRKILIPTIPSYSDALVHHKTQYKDSKPRLSFMADWQIKNLTRYLYPELEHQRHAILFQVETETENYLLPYLERYNMKPRYIFTKGKKMLLVKEWNPQTYPKAIRER